MKSERHIDNAELSNSQRIISDNDHSNDDGMKFYNNDLNPLFYTALKLKQKYSS